MVFLKVAKKVNSKSKRVKSYAKLIDPLALVAQLKSLAYINIIAVTKAYS